MNIDFDQIQKNISDTHQLLQSLHERLNHTTPISTSSDKVLNISQTASLVNLSKATMCGMVYERRVPFHYPKETRRLYFIHSESMEWLKHKCKSTTDALDEQDRKIMTTRINRST